VATAKRGPLEQAGSAGLQALPQTSRGPSFKVKGAKDVTDVDRAWTDVGCDRSIVALDRMAEAGAPAGRYHHRPSALHPLHSHHHDDPAQRAAVPVYVADKPVTQQFTRRAGASELSGSCRDLACRPVSAIPL
jgi:hypothetical protein